MQSKRMSLIEAAVNSIVGFGASVAVGQVLFPALGFDVGLSQNY
jgi:hypothetical protein